MVLLHILCHVECLPALFVAHISSCAALLQTPTSSDILLVWEVTKCLPSWLDVATHLGCTSDYIKNIHDKEMTVPSHSVDSFNNRCRIQLCAEWLARSKGTGNKPRTWKGVLVAFKRCCVWSKSAHEDLSLFERNLIGGQELHSGYNHDVD